MMKQAFRPSTGIKAYLWIWCLSMWLPLLDGTFLGNGAGGLDARPLVDNDYQYLLPLIGLLMVALIVESHYTVGVACLAHAVDLTIRWQRMPTVWDHEQWAMQIELTFLLMFIPHCYWKTSRHPQQQQEKETAFFATGRSQLVIFYAAATFWKFNSSFFDTNVSCGTVLIVEALATYLPFLKPGVIQAMGRWAPHKTILLEGAIATTMASSRRHMAVVLATCFHLLIFLLPVNAAGGFSMDCTTRFIVFFTSQELEQYWNKMSIYKEGALSTLVALGFGSLRFYSTNTPMDFGFTGMCLLLTFYLRVVHANTNTSGVINTTHDKAKNVKASRYQWFVRALVLSLAVIYGFLTVILGVQHMGAPTMYSNLRYYHNGGNHFLVPVSVLSDKLIYGGGLVQVSESTSASLNQRLAYIASEDVFPPQVLTKIRVATNQTKLPVQLFPLCISNPHSRELLATEYEPSNPKGSSNFLPFILPINEVRKALSEEVSSPGDYVVKLKPDTSSTPGDRVIVLTKTTCEIQMLNELQDCGSDLHAQLILLARPNDPTEKHHQLITWIVSKLQTPYPQLVGMREEICMS